MGVDKLMMEGKERNDQWLSMIQNTHDPHDGKTRSSHQKPRSETGDDLTLKRLSGASQYAMAKEIPWRQMRHTPRVVVLRSITYEVSVSASSRHSLGGQCRPGFLVNISNGGFCLKTRDRLQKKMILKVAIPMSNTSPVIPTLAEVVWVIRDRKRKVYRAGLKFII